MEILKKTGLYDKIGEDHLFKHTGEAIQYALDYIEKPNCLGCQHYAFRECTQLSKGSKTAYPNPPVVVNGGPSVAEDSKKVYTAISQ